MILPEGTCEKGKRQRESPDCPGQRAFAGRAGWRLLLLSCNLPPE